MTSYTATWEESPVNRYIRITRLRDGCIDCTLTLDSNDLTIDIWLTAPDIGTHKQGESVIELQKDYCIITLVNASMVIKRSHVNYLFTAIMKLLVIKKFVQPAKYHINVGHVKRTLGGIIFAVQVTDSSLNVVSEINCYIASLDHWDSSQKLNLSLDVGQCITLVGNPTGSTLTINDRVCMYHFDQQTTDEFINKLRKL